MAEKDYIPEDERNDDFYVSQRKAAQEKQAKIEKDASIAKPSAKPFAPSASPQAGFDVSGEDTGPVLKMKTADMGKAIAP